MSRDPEFLNLFLHMSHSMLVLVDAISLKKMKAYDECSSEMRSLGDPPVMIQVIDKHFSGREDFGTLVTCKLFAYYSSRAQDTLKQEYCRYGAGTNENR